MSGSTMTVHAGLTGQPAVLTDRALFLAWAKPSHTRRSALIAKRLGIPLRRVHVLKMKPYLAPIRYAAQAVLTLVVLFRERPRLVFVQNPPIFAPLFVWLYCALTGSRFIIDSHTDALQGPWWRWAWGLHAFLARRAIATLVTNRALANKLERWGARSQIILDVPSDLPLGQPFPLRHRFNVVLVGSYSTDEPLDEVIAAARDLPEVGFFITGDPVQGFKPVPTHLPPNVTLTGYLSDEKFYGLMRSVQAVMVLTTEDNTMQRGACEAVWLGQPIITSDWPLLREAFHRGTIHVDNSVAGIGRGVEAMQARYSELAREVLALQSERQQLWDEAVARLAELVGDA